MDARRVHHVLDNSSWDRGLQSITIESESNVSFSPPLTTLVHGAHLFDLNASRPDHAQPSSFTIRATDIDGNTTTSVISTEGSAVDPFSEPELRLSAYPTPFTGSTRIEINGAPAADVTISDILGRTIRQFHIFGSYEWNTSSLPSGTYIVRAQVEERVLQIPIVKE